MTKPPYRVPLMAEIAKTRKNGLKVASTFSGAGGSCLGYKMAGMRVVWANEFEPTAAATYAANHPDTILDTRSIREVKGQDILDLVGEVDILDGSPPCQSFSMAGKRDKGWGEDIAHADGTTQVSDDLFFEYARLLGELKPKAFIAENVKGMVQGIAKGYFKEIMAALEGQGYTIEARILNAMWLGVPQSRQRVIIIGMRNDLGISPKFPTPLPYRYSMLDACPWFVDTEIEFHDEDDGQFPVPKVTVVKKRGRFNTDHEEGIDYDAPAPTVGAIGMGASAGPAAVVVRTEIQLSRPGHGYFPGDLRSLDRPAPTVTAMGGKTWGSVVVKAKNGPGFTENTLTADDPALTITASNARAPRVQTHQDSGFGEQSVELDQPITTITATAAATGNAKVKLINGTTERTLTIAEVIRLCSYPDDFEFQGSYEQQWARLGNSVPPLMMKAVAQVTARQLLALKKRP